MSQCGIVEIIGQSSPTIEVIERASITVGGGGDTEGVRQLVVNATVTPLPDQLIFGSIADAYDSARAFADDGHVCDIVLTQMVTQWTAPNGGGRYDFTGIRQLVGPPGDSFVQVDDDVIVEDSRDVIWSVRDLYIFPQSNSTRSVPLIGASNSVRRQAFFGSSAVFAGTSYAGTAPFWAEQTGSLYAILVRDGEFILGNNQTSELIRLSGSGQVDVFNTAALKIQTGAVRGAGSNFFRMIATPGSEVIGPLPAGVDFNVVPISNSAKDFVRTHSELKSGWMTKPVVQVLAAGAVTVPGVTGADDTNTTVIRYEYDDGLGGTTVLHRVVVNQGAVLFDEFFRSWDAVTRTASDMYAAKPLIVR